MTDVASAGTPTTRRSSDAAVSRLAFLTPGTAETGVVTIVMPIPPGRGIPTEFSGARVDRSTYRMLGLCARSTETRHPLGTVVTKWRPRSVVAEARPPRVDDDCVAIAGVHDQATNMATTQIEIRTRTALLSSARLPISPFIFRGIGGREGTRVEQQNEAADPVPRPLSRQRPAPTLSILDPRPAGRAPLRRCRSAALGASHRRYPEAWSGKL
jgi:hypothetical protein